MCQDLKPIAGFNCFEKVILVFKLFFKGFIKCSENIKVQNKKTPFAGGFFVFKTIYFFLAGATFATGFLATGFFVGATGFLTDEAVFF